VKVESKQKAEDRTRAQELATRTGVPVWGAFRVIRGELSLNELLKSLMRREKFARLQQGGLAPDLAGHVASGALEEWRAQALQDMRNAGRVRFAADRIEIAHREKLRTAVWRFGQADWEVGQVTKSRTYDFRFQVGQQESDVYKHDVKMLCNPDDLSDLRAASGHDEQLHAKGLGASKDRHDRYRPSDKLLCTARDSESDVKWMFRDGTAVSGRVHAFGRWDMDLVLDSGTYATLFFHALHSNTEVSLSSSGS